MNTTKSRSQLLQQQALVLQRSGGWRATRKGRLCTSAACMSFTCFCPARPPNFCRPRPEKQQSHFDVSVWAWEKLADKKWGVIGKPRRRAFAGEGFSAFAPRTRSTCLARRPVRRRQVAPSAVHLQAGPRSANPFMAVRQRARAPE